MLLRKLVALWEEDSNSIEQYLKDFKDVSYQLSHMEANDLIVPNDLVILLLMNSLPSKY